MDYLQEIKETLSAGQLDETKLSGINLKLQALQAEAEALLKSHEAVKLQSIDRKSKLGQLSTKILQYQDLQTKLSVKDAELQKLNAFKQAAINQKKQKVAIIKNLFDYKLDNKTSKDYHKYKNMSSQFNFDDLTEQGLNRNLLAYQILESAGTFDNDMLMIRQPSLPKSDSNKQKKDKNRSFL